MFATIVSYVMLTENVVELVLDVPAVIPYIPGQRAFLSYSADIPLKRAYSIVNYKVQDDHCQITLAIKLLPGGKGSELLKAKKQGDTIEILGIYGRFVLQETENPKVFIGTGTGIAPLMSMAERASADKKLYFSVSYAKDLFYEEKIASVLGLESHIHITREVVEGCEVWRIDLSKENFPKESEFYICWSPASVKTFQEQLKANGYEKIYTEQY